MDVASVHWQNGSGEHQRTILNYLICVVWQIKYSDFSWIWNSTSLNFLTSIEKSLKSQCCVFSTLLYLPYPPLPNVSLHLPLYFLYSCSYFCISANFLWAFLPLRPPHTHRHHPSLLPLLSLTATLNKWGKMDKQLWFMGTACSSCWLL